MYTSTVHFSWEEILELIHTKDGKKKIGKLSSMKFQIKVREGKHSYAIASNILII